MFSWIIPIAELLGVVAKAVSAAAHEPDPVKATAAGMAAASEALQQSSAKVQTPAG